MLRYRTLLLTGVLLLGCNVPERPIQPVDAATTQAVYDVELDELRKLLPKTTPENPVPWKERMYLNTRILLPEADSANPLRHDQPWLNSAVARGLIRGYCGHPPDEACPDSIAVAFTSLGVPWTRGGDTVFVGGGYTGLVPGQKKSDAIFWLFTVIRGDSGWVVKAKGPPNTMTFVDSTAS